MGLNQGAFRKMAYGLFFTLVLPAGLWAWTARVETSLPALRSTATGMSIFVIGAICVLWGMRDLWSIGGGLPMNAFPPPNPVRKGIYGLIPHPIYTGSTLVAAGWSIWTGSATGLWLTTPLVALGCMALVLGYEGPDLRKRFPPEHLPRPWLGVPRGSGEATPLDRFGALVLVVGIWSIAYFAVKFLGLPSGARETRLDLEWNIPLLPSSMFVYSSVYLVVPFAFLLASDKFRLRSLANGALWSTAVNSLVYFSLPLTAQFRENHRVGRLAAWMDWEQELARPAAGSFPSFHATWAVLAACSLSRGKSKPIKSLWALWCLALCASCLTTGMHSLADVAAGSAVGWALADPSRLWSRVVGWTERIGNSWKSWTCGPLRIMSHAVWSGLAGFVGVLLVGSAAGPSQLGWWILVASCSLVGAALWAQWIEGSSMLLRPFGYYGSILGGLVAIILVRVAEGPAVSLLGAFAIASPFVQAIGRMRCVVQGCCHGRPVAWGIRIVNPHSRVVKLAGFAGTPIHPTPVYSILGNLATGLLAMRLWFVGVPALFIAGVYLVLAGMLRFVEEAYRGEPQTETILGLPLYQWLAIGSAVLGLVLLAIPSSEVLELTPPSFRVIVAATIWGLVSAFAMSMDFPNSSARFSRLTG